MKKKEYLIMCIAACICVFAWLMRPSFFEKDNGLIYAKTFDSDQSSTTYNVTSQQEIKTNIEHMKAEKSYDETSPLMIYDPYDTNTLSMYIYFETAKDASVSYTIHVHDENIPDYSNTISNRYTKTHEFTIIGLIPQMDNEITFHVTYKDATQKDYTYSYIMSGLKGKEDISLSKHEGTSTQQVSEGLYVILGNDSSDDDFMYLYDNNGILRGEIPIEEYRSHRLIFQNGLMYFSYNKHKIAAMNNLGQITATYDLGIYELHHDYVFDDYGNILILATDTTSESEEDCIISLNPNTNDVTLIADVSDLLSEYKKTTSKVDDTWDWLHLNTIQWMGNDEIIVSSRETSTIMKFTNIYDNIKIDYMLGDLSFWETTPYKDLLYQKAGDFISQCGQHSVTYVEDESLQDGQYYLYMFNNNYGYSSTNKAYDWSQIGCVTNKNDQQAVSKYYKYLVDENTKTYTLVDSFDVPFSGYVSSVQDIGSTTIVDSGTAKNFQEYDASHELIQSFDMEAENFIYRVYKYDFDGFYFHNN